jgi:hypothetical protein
LQERDRAGESGLHRGRHDFGNMAAFEILADRAVGWFTVVLDLVIQFDPAAHPHKRWSLLDPAHEKQNDKDNQNDADDPDAAVTVPVSITAEASTESAKQEDDENDDEDQSDRHEGCPPSGLRQLRHAMP